MSGLDYSHLGGAPSYSDALSGAGDMLLQAIKIRDARRAHEAKVLQDQNALQRQSYKDNQELQIQRDHNANEEQKVQLEGRRYGEGRDAAATAAVEKAYREGGLPAARTVAGGYNAPLTVEHTAPEPGPEPQEPHAPEPVKRPEDLPIPGSGMWPPELRAMLAASQAKAAAAPPSPGPPPGAAGAVGPEEARPEGPTQPPPANADAVDNEIYKSHAQEMAEWEAKHKAREESQRQLAAYEASRAGKPSPAEAAAREGYQQQGEMETKYLHDRQGFDEASQRFPIEQAAYHRSRMEYDDSARPVLALGERKVPLPTQGELDQPNEKAAQDFLAAQLPTAKDPVQVTNIKRIAASIRSGTMKPTEAGKSLETTSAEQRKGAQTDDTNRTYRLTAEEQTRQKELDRASRERAAAATGQRGNANIDVKEKNNYESVAQHELGNALAKTDVKELQEAKSGLHALQAPNGVQGQVAIDKLIAGAMHGRATNGSIQRAWNAIPAVDRLENQVVLQTTGHHSPKVLKILRDTLTEQVASGDERAKAILGGLNESMGLRSAHAQNPGLLPYVKAKMRGAHAALGQDIPPELQDEAPAQPKKKKTGGTAQELLDDNGY